MPACPTSPLACTCDGSVIAVVRHLAVQRGGEEVDEGSDRLPLGIGITRRSLRWAEGQPGRRGIRVGQAAHCAVGVASCYSRWHGLLRRDGPVTLTTRHAAPLLRHPRCLGPKAPMRRWAGTGRLFRPRQAAPARLAAWCIRRAPPQGCRDRSCRGLATVPADRLGGTALLASTKVYTTGARTLEGQVFATGLTDGSRATS